jgi:ribulose-phosphate 3-epimerase
MALSARCPNGESYASLRDASHGVRLGRESVFMALIAPSLLAADFARLADALAAIKGAGATMVHVEVMDGHFVPDISVGQPVIRSLRKATDLVLDVHLLIERPERYVQEFVEAGADRLSVHAEATPHLHRVLEQIRRQGAKGGVALNPGTPLESLSDILGEVDFLSVLTADPGLQERGFIPRSLEKIRAAARAREVRRLDFLIQAEGGIGANAVEELIQAGADILVAGSAIFLTDDP